MPPGWTILGQSSPKSATPHRLISMYLEGEIESQIESEELDSNLIHHTKTIVRGRVTTPSLLMSTRWSSASQFSSISLELKSINSSTLK